MVQNDGGRQWFISVVVDGGRRWFMSKVVDGGSVDPALLRPDEMKMIIYYLVLDT